NRPALVGLFCITLFALAAILAPVIAPFDPYEMNGSSLDAPSLTHLFGTDLLGRDIFSRVLYGAQISLFVGVGAVVLALLIGGVLGAIAGGFGGRIVGGAVRPQRRSPRHDRTNAPRRGQGASIAGHGSLFPGTGRIGHEGGAGRTSGGDQGRICPLGTHHQGFRHARGLMGLCAARRVHDGC
ncbi:MAG: hypothetical protein EBU77_09680, partial [Betaproteobacteria bacterium]|nr:hypothetical protein [Betaproteobacteria bacterium]